MPALLAENVVHFVRILRAAGLPVGPERTLIALRALAQVGLARRDDVHAALSCVLIDRHEHQMLFDAAFDAFWQDPKTLERMLATLLPRIEGRGQRVPAPRSARLDEALAGTRPPPARRGDSSPSGEDRVDIEAVMTWSDRERLASRDFESMTRDEFLRARRLVERIDLSLPPITTRRFETAAQGRTDLRAALRRMARDPYLAAPPLRRRRQRPPPLVVLCDVSGSMEPYSRMLLHYAHALMRRHRRMHVFTFGTRLTDITRQLRFRDVDAALQAAARIVSDWNGGTRIGESLAQFNRVWARRVLTGSATVLLITDGLDREDDGRLAREAARLARYTREIVWLNPLLRFDGFEPRAAGIRALLPHVDRFLPVHNLHSLEQLAAALARPLPRRRRGASPMENDRWK